MIERPEPLNEIRQALRRSRVVALIGPRQCGKTTLARKIEPAASTNYFDLEDPASLARLEQPMTALESLRGIVVIDEVQHRPNLFPLLRVLADRKPLPARFLILGSASPELLHQSSESLAGRLETVFVAGLRLSEVGTKSLVRHWQRGGFPLSFLARTNDDSHAWRRQFIQTFLERDLAQLGVNIPAPGSIAVLDDGSALPREHLERCRSRSLARHRRVDRAPLPGSIHETIGRTATAALA